MTQIIINLNNKEEETFVETFLKKMKISFEKNEDDFELTDEMKRVIDEALKQDRSTAVDGKESLKRIRAKYGL
jgi:ribosomal protein S20